MSAPLLHPPHATLSLSSLSSLSPIARPPPNPLRSHVSAVILRSSGMPLGAWHLLHVDLRGIYGAMSALQKNEKHVEAHAREIIMMKASLKHSQSAVKCTDALQMRVISPRNRPLANAACIFTQPHLS